MSGASLTIAPSRADEHSRCYEFAKKPRFLVLNPCFYKEGMILVQNQGDIRNQLIELHRTIYNKKRFFKKKIFAYMHGNLKK
jgi:hypothetical protein